MFGKARVIFSKSKDASVPWLYLERQNGYKGRPICTCVLTWYVMVSRHNVGFDLMRQKAAHVCFSLLRTGSRGTG